MRFKLDYFYNIKESIKDDIKHDIKKRLLNSIIRNDICFLKENSPYLIENAEELVEKSVDMNLDNDTIMWIINKYKHIMDMEKVFNVIISNGKIKIAQELYEKNMGTWSFSAVLDAALKGNKKIVEWCVNIKQPNILEKLQLYQYCFEGGFDLY